VEGRGEGGENKTENFHDTFAPLFERGQREEENEKKKGRRDGILCLVDVREDKKGKEKGEGEQGQRNI